MSAETYDVYFSGAILKDADSAEVKRKIGAMFKLEGDKLERLFSGQPRQIKRGIDMDQAIRFRVAFRDAGALVDIVPAGEPPPDPAARAAAKPRPEQPLPPAGQTPESRPSEPATSGLTLADGPLPVPPQPPAPPIQAPDYGLSAPKEFNLSDCAPPVEPAPLPDISALDLDKAGVIIDESPSPQPLEIDIEALMLDAPGTTLIETEEVAPPQIDTDRLSMSAPNEGSLEEFQKPVPPAPLPDIGHLHLEEAEAKAKPQGKAKFTIAED
jgi:hypothetical protein